MSLAYCMVVDKDCVPCSIACARALRALILESKPDHVELWLQQMLQGHMETLGAAR